MSHHAHDINDVRLSIGNLLCCAAVILEKERKLSPDNGNSAEGRAFLDAQLVRGGQMLGDLWFSAWQQATEDRFLIAELKKRQPKQDKK